MIIPRRSIFLRQDARILKISADLLITWTDQEAISGVAISSRRTKRVISRGSLHVGKKGILRNRNTSGLLRLALRRGSVKGALVKFEKIAFIVFMIILSRLGNICW